MLPRSGRAGTIQRFPPALENAHRRRELDICASLRGLRHAAVARSTTRHCAAVGDAIQASLSQRTRCSSPAPSASGCAPRARRPRARRRPRRPRRPSGPRAHLLRPSSAPRSGCWGSAATCSPAHLLLTWHAAGAGKRDVKRLPWRARRGTRWALHARELPPALALHASRSWRRRGAPRTRAQRASAPPSAPLPRRCAAWRAQA